MRPHISIRGLVRPLVGPSVGWLVRNAFVKHGEMWIFRDFYGFEMMDKERGTRRKEGQGGRRDKEEEATRMKQRRGV